MAITKKQKDVYDYITSYFGEFGYAPTQKEIKEQFELKSFGSVQRYIKYLTEAGYLASDWNARRGLKPTVVKPSQSVSTGIEIPLLGRVAAGNPIEAIENADETILIPPGLIGNRGQHFALRVQGDSMIEAGILPEDLIVCRYQEQANDGQIVVALLDGEATVKTFRPKKNWIELHPANHKLKLIKVTQETGDFRLAGVLVALVRSYEPVYN